MLLQMPKESCALRNAELHMKQQTKHEKKQNTKTTNNTATRVAKSRVKQPALSQHLAIPAHVRDKPDKPSKHQRRQSAIQFSSECTAAPPTVHDRVRREDCVVNAPRGWSAWGSIRWIRYRAGKSSRLETALAWSSPVPKWFPLTHGKCCFLDYTPGWKSSLAGKKPWEILGWKETCVSAEGAWSWNINISEVNVNLLKSRP